MLCAEVLIESLPAGVERDIFSYAVPAQWQGELQVGSEVAVPFGSETRLGYVLDLHQQPPAGLELRDILQITGQQYLPPDYLHWLKQVARYYLSSLSQVVFTALPRRLGARLQTFVKPLPNAANMLAAVESRYGTAHDLYRMAAFLVSAAPQYKTRQSCYRHFGKAKAQKYLRSLQQDGLIAVWTEVQAPAAPKTQLSLRYLQPAPEATRRQQELLVALQAQGGMALLSEFCQQQQTSTAVLRRLAEQGALEIGEARVLRRPLDEAADAQAKSQQVLTPAQQAVFDQIIRALDAEQPAPILLHGVTGSGKTEVYLHALAAVLEKGQGGLFLVPEIALTPQMLRRCRAVFGEQVAVLHSALSTGEYFDEWERIRSGAARVVVGARSAIFAPVQDLQLIIIDEEHESAYKQDSGLRYDARQLAGLRMHNRQGLLLLGSATPRLEAYARAQSGRWTYLSLPQRVHAQPLPPVNVVDMRQEQLRGNVGVFSQTLQHQLGACLERQEQAILLLNRRGYAGSWLCRDCGEAVGCPLCAVSLTYHQSQGLLKCHYCDYQQAAPRSCPVCHSSRIQGFGLGTQRLTEITQKCFPAARILRLDRDTTQQKDSHQHLLDAFGRGEADILIGTQMVAKGLDFPRVTLVGILAADQALTLPDFRAAERTFQLLTQAAGRAGRSDLPGRIVLQTYAPDHPAIRHALAHDYAGFYASEMPEREALAYPPFGELARILFAHGDHARAWQTAEAFAQELLALNLPDVTLRGPVDAPLSRLQSLYRVHLVLKHPRMQRLKPALRQLRSRFQPQVQILSVDIDPYSML